MKKIFFFMLFFFCFAPITFAETVIDNIETNVFINENGSANVQEVWNISDKSIYKLKKTIKLVSGTNVSDLKISSDSCGEFILSGNSNVNKCEYYIEQHKNDVSIVFFVNKIEDYNIVYNITGFISSYNDTSGINFKLLVPTENERIIKYNVIVSSYLGFNEFNTSLSLITNIKNISKNFKDDKINISANDLTSNSRLYLLTTFSGINYDNKNIIDMNFEDYYKSVENKNSIKNLILNYASNMISKVIVGIILLLVLFSFIKKMVKTKFINSDFYGFKSRNKINEIKLENVNYFDSIPCNYDLYEISFISGYYKISKNRSNLIGAYLLKWDYEGLLRVSQDERGKYQIEIPNKNQYFSRPLDKDLFDILFQSSYNNIIVDSRLIKFCESHYLRVMTWFNMGYNESINDFINKKYITRTKKFKSYIYYLEDIFYKTGIDIAGVKKYLINFNQVPRKTQLTEQNYKYLLILAELFGIGEQVANEILRKNPDNYMASELLKLEKAGYIYKKVFTAASEPYKQVVKNKKRSQYDFELEEILKNKKNNNDIKSKL